MLKRASQPEKPRVFTLKPAFCEKRIFFKKIIMSESHDSRTPPDDPAAAMRRLKNHSQTKRFYRQFGNAILFSSHGCFGII